ncbi:MAG: hypothetical protein U1D00_21480 [Mycobacterium sp.]|nr:hypothetical protein [Mycobacterium sp.]
MKNEWYIEVLAANATGDDVTTYVLRNLEPATLRLLADDLIAAERSGRVIEDTLAAWAVVYE